MKKYCLIGALGLALAGLSASASAAVVLNTTPGTDPYSGPPVTYDFDTTIPVFTGGAIVPTSQSGQFARPYGASGNYYSVGPSTSSPGTIDLSLFSDIGQLSFIWGSVDRYNTIEVLSRTGAVLQSFTGSDVINSQFGNQSLPSTNPLVTLDITGSDQTNIGGIRLRSSSNAFEIDNISVQAAVPEPGTWALMLLGFGLVGGAMRRGKTSGIAARLRYAF